jgi:hypothetical protein
MIPWKMSRSDIKDFAKALGITLIICFNIFIVVGAIYPESERSPFYEEPEENITPLEPVVKPEY